MKYNILLFKKDGKKEKEKKERNGALFRLYYYFFFPFISYTYYLILENMALQAFWPIDPTNLLQPNLTP